MWDLSLLLTKINTCMKLSLEDHRKRLLIRMTTWKSRGSSKSTIWTTVKILWQSLVFSWTNRSCQTRTFLLTISRSSLKCSTSILMPILTLTLCQGFKIITRCLSAYRNTFKMNRAIPLLLQDKVLPMFTFRTNSCWKISNKLMVTETSPPE